MAKCSAKNCSVKNAIFAYSKTDKSKYCAKHKVPGMIDVISKTCEEDRCDTIPNFNFRGQTKGIRCSDHRLEGMIDVKNKTCEEDNCVKQPHFNFRGLKKGIRCADHRLEGMIDVISKRCASCGLFQATNPQKDYMCSQCFMFNNPNHEYSRHYKTKELTFTKQLKQDLLLSGIDCVLDSKISGGCSRRRPDVFIDMLTHVLIIEIDENQHLSYDESCEYVRTIELNEDIGHRPMYIIRLNPDSYKLNGKSIRGCFTSKMELNKKEFTHRYSTLLSTVLDLTATPPERLIDSIELFFTESE